MNGEIRTATRRDYHALVAVRAEWLDTYCRIHPAPERWCPACVMAPNVETEDALRAHLNAGEDGRWAAVLSIQGLTKGYILCRDDREKKELRMENHTPRIAPDRGLDDAGNALVEFALARAVDHGLERASVALHGAPDEVAALMELYGKYGFEGRLRLEMLGRQFRLDPGPPILRFVSAAEAGLPALYEMDAVCRRVSAADAERDHEFTRKMWCVCDSDFVAAFQGENLVGTVRVAITREGVGVLDTLAVRAEHRGRGFGRCVLAHALTCLAGRCDIVWLDVDQDNAPALRLYAWAGLREHHHHCSLARAFP